MQTVIKELDFKQFHTPDIRKTRIINADLKNHLTDTVLSPAVNYKPFFY